MEQAEGFEKEGKEGRAGRTNRRHRRWVCRLKKGLYGLKQSGRLWYHKLCEVLKGLGFKQIKSDPSIYIWFGDGIRIILPVFVDDITITCIDKSKIEWVKKRLSEIFKVKELGATSYLLGIKVEYDRDTWCLALSQKQYIVDMLERFGLSDCKPISTPMNPGIILTKKETTLPQYRYRPRCNSNQFGSGF